MKKFKVTASYMTYLSVEIEAKSLDEAQRIADDMDGSEFNRDGYGDWEIDDAIEIIEAP